MFKNKRYILSLLLFFGSSVVTAQNIPSLYLTQISESNGLSDNKVQCILKESDEQLWIGTSDGLNLVNGSVIKKFSHLAGQVNSLPDNNILSLAEDTKGTTWIGTGKGLCRYNKDKQSFTSIVLPASEYGSTAIINSICFISANELLLGTDGGLLLWNSATQNATGLFNKQGDAKDNFRFCNNINKVLRDSDKNTWLCTHDGFWKLTLATKKFTRINGKNSNAIYNPLCLFAFESSDKKLWIGNWQTGLQQVDKTTDSVISFIGSEGNIHCINELPLADGKYLLLLNGALQAFDPFANRFVQLPKPYSLAQTPNVQTIHRSKDGWLWLGTDNQGLFIANPATQHFQHHFFEGNITSQSVLLNEWHDSLLIGGEGTGLLRLYSTDWQINKDFYENIFPSPANNEIFATLSLAKQHDNSWWIGTTAGLVHINPLNNGRRWFTGKRTDSTRLPSNFITHVFLDSSQQLWIFPWRQGVWKMDMQGRKFHRVCSGFIKQATIEKKLVITDAAEDSGGNIWMADMDEGIILFTKSDSSFSKPFAKQLGERVATSRVYFRNGFMYSFTGNALLKWKDVSTLQIIDLPAGTGKEIFDMAPDKNNNWWLACKNGLICYNENQHSFKRFATADGLIDNVLDGTLYCRNNGDMVFAKANYCTSFSPEKLLTGSRTKQKLLLTGISVNDSLYPTGNNRLNLTYRQNNIVFQWALPNFINPFSNQYYCQLKGIDSNWRYVGNKGEIQYANLAPGVYTILLKAATANGIEASNIITYQFIIQAPYWKRNWFLLSIAAFLALIIFSLVKKRITAIRKKAAFQNQLAELEMKALRAQMNPHFIFNSLNSIQECIVTKNTDAAYTYLSQFSKLVRRVLENSGKATVPVAEELELMKWYLTLEQLRFTDEFTFQIQNKFSNPHFEIPSMIIQPFLENALWHGLANKQGEKKLLLLLYESLHAVNIVIEDNGIGRKAAAALPAGENKTSMGLQIAKERLEHYSYASSVEINDLIDPEGNANGTKVVIHLPNY